MSCPDCVSGAIWEGVPTGSEQTIHGVKTYIAVPQSQHKVKSTIIFITDAFGFNLVNSKLLADQYAAQTSLRVLMPDVIPGGGVPIHSLELMESIQTPVKWWNLIGHARRLVTIFRMMTIFVPFAIRTRAVFPSILTFTRAVKASLPHGGKLGVAGFCWGALQTTKLSAEPAVEGGSEPLVDAHFAAHPSGLKAPGDFVEAAKRFHVPFSMAEGGQDMILSKEAIIQVEAALRSEYSGCEDRVEVKVYDECGHGFAVRASPKKTNETKAAGEALQQAIEWFKKYLA